jgi:agmatinase
MLANSGREIIGFDLNEVSPGPNPDSIDHNDWDGNVGARMLYRMCNLTGVSRGELKYSGQS